MSNQVNSMGKGLTVKDLVTTGIFTALVFVFVLVAVSFLHLTRYLHSYAGWERSACRSYFSADDRKGSKEMEPFHHGRCHLYHLVRYGYALGFCAGLSDYGGGCRFCCRCRTV